MPPTPPPTIINMPPTGAPWWAPYLLAGLFVIFGAAIGLISTHLSDKRKLRADDRRQWDKEIRDLYLEADAAYRVVRDAWSSSRTHIKSEYPEAEQAVEDLARVASSLELIANELTTDAAWELARRGQFIVDYLPKGHGLPNERFYIELKEAREELREYVKKDIRTHPGRAIEISH